MRADAGAKVTGGAGYTQSTSTCRACSTAKVLRIPAPPRPDRHVHRRRRPHDGAGWRSGGVDRRRPGRPGRPATATATSSRTSRSSPSTGSATIGDPVVALAADTEASRRWPPWSGSRWSTTRCPRSGHDDGRRPGRRRPRAVPRGRRSAWSRPTGPAPPASSGPDRQRLLPLSSTRPARPTPSTTVIHVFTDTLRLRRPASSTSTSSRSWPPPAGAGSTGAIPRPGSRCGPAARTRSRSARNSVGCSGIGEHRIRLRVPYVGGGLRGQERLQDRADRGPAGPGEPGGRSGTA